MPCADGVVVAAAKDAAPTVHQRAHRTLVLPHATLRQEGCCAPGPHAAIVTATEEAVPHHLESPYRICVSCSRPTPFNTRFCSLLKQCQDEQVSDTSASLSIRFKLDAETSGCHWNAVSLRLDWESSEHRGPSYSDTTTISRNFYGR